MPNLNIYVLEGHAEARKQALLQRVSRSVAETLAAPLGNVRIFLIELKKTHVCVAGDMLMADAGEGAGVATAQAFLVAGRTPAQKAALIEAVTTACVEELGLPAAVVRIMVVDVPSSDFGIGGVTAAALGR